MEKQLVTTRGLSPLEMQIAELALSIKAEGEKLPENLAQKLIKDVYRATSKAAGYYATISGRKNYAIEDVGKAISEIPRNTLFTSSDIKEMVAHNPVSVASALRKIADTDEKANILEVGNGYRENYYLKPTDRATQLDFSYRTKDVGTKIYAAISCRTFCDSEGEGDITRLDPKESSHLVEMMALKKRKDRRKKWKDNEEEDKVAHNREIALKVLNRAEESIFSKIAALVKETGYLPMRYNSPIDSDDPSWISPYVISCLGERNRPVGVDLYAEMEDFRGGTSFELVTREGNRMRCFWEKIINQCVAHSGLTIPKDITGKRTTTKFWYSPQDIKIVRKIKFAGIEAEV